MTRVSSYTEIIKRHHVTTPVEYGTIADVEMLANIARQQCDSTYDDAARLVPDDENIHLVWEEPAEKEAKTESELMEFYKWVSAGDDTIFASRLASLIKQYREDTA